MPLSFDRTVAALAESIIRDHWTGAESEDPRFHATAAAFLMDQYRRMPDYLRLPFRCLTLTFDAWSLPRTGCPFHRASLAQRVRQIRTWKSSRFGFRRDLIKFFESLAIFAWYSERETRPSGP